MSYNVVNEPHNRRYVYVPSTQADAEKGFLVASTAASAIMGTMPLYSKPFTKQVLKEHARNHLYKDAFLKSIENSGLKDKGLSFVNVVSTLGNNVDKTLVDIQKGVNACYSPTTKQVLVNAEKASITGFHELGHAMNHLNSPVGKFLQKLRKPGYVIAGLMGTLALFSRPKPKEAKRNALDVVLDNSGKIAFAALLPTVVEEAMASYKGIKLAKQAGLKKPLINNLKKFYGKALLSYAGYAVATGLSVFAASKIMQHYTRPKKVDMAELNNYR